MSVKRKKPLPEPHREDWEFTIVLHGIGADRAAAWEDAVEGFTQDTGGVPDDSESKLLDDEDDQ